MFLKFVSQDEKTATVVECKAFKCISGYEEIGEYFLNVLDVIYTNEVATSEFDPFEHDDFLPFHIVGYLPKDLRGNTPDFKYRYCYVMNDEGETIDCIRASYRKIQKKKQS